jgi:anti-sigma-K factor RskA
MSQADDIGGGFEGDQVLVAEYVLGLLGAAEHQTVRRRIAAEPALAAEQRLWTLRLASLDHEFAEVAAPVTILPRLEARLFGTTQASGLAGWWNSLAVWRSLAGTAAAIAVVAVGFNVLQPRPDANVIATQLVAALQSQEGSGVEFVAFYDTNSGSVRLLGLSGAAVPEKDFELWYIKGDEAPVSMGVIPVDQRTEIPLDAAGKSKIAAGTVLAVTLETKGGSPTGAPQGPVVAAGAATVI